PYCCVIKCCNSWKIGYTMHVLPKNCERRQQWIRNIGGYDFDPAKNYFVCNVHFPANMWEKPRVDGKQKSKNTAIPTIFPKKKELVSSNKDCSAFMNVRVI
ncbi:hypothetical protein ALC57_07779, partial [Trachymyrmex cornetzi]